MKIKDLISLSLAFTIGLNHLSQRLCCCDNIVQRVIKNSCRRYYLCIYCGIPYRNLLSVKSCTAILQACETVPKRCMQHLDPVYSVFSKAELKFLHTIQRSCPKSQTGSEKSVARAKPGYCRATTQSGQVTNILKSI